MDSLNLDEEKEIILKKFRNVMSDLLEPRHDDRFLLRWLRAREFNLQQAEKMLREDFKQRKRYRADTLLKWYKRPEVAEHIASAYLGFDRMGHLVRMVDFGSTDGKGIFRSLSMNELLMTCCWILEWDKEKLKMQNKMTNREVETFLYIIDYSKLRLSQWCDTTVIRAAITLAQKYQNHYPESLFKVYGLNVPSFIVYLTNNVLKPFLADKVMEKINFFAAGDLSYQEELFSLVPRDIVPAYIGGSRHEPAGDPTCNGLFKRKPKVPSSFYLTQQKPLSSKDPDVREVIVHERGIFEFEQKIDEPGVLLCWQFQTKENNIRFGLYYRRKSDPRSEREELIPVEGIESNSAIEKGEYECDEEGTYILYFDNTYSWFRSKHLLYKVEVRQPDPIEDQDIFLL